MSRLLLVAVLGVVVAAVAGLADAVLTARHGLEVSR